MWEFFIISSWTVTRWETFSEASTTGTLVDVIFTTTTSNGTSLTFSGSEIEVIGWTVTSVWRESVSGTGDTVFSSSGTGDTLWSTSLTFSYVFNIKESSWTSTIWFVDSVSGTWVTIGFESRTVSTFVRTFFTGVGGVIEVIWAVTKWSVNSVFRT
jgi:hypothetical protein